jgi:integrase/recombinase XerD
MTALIDEYKTELEDVLSFMPDTVVNYLGCILQFHSYAKKELLISPDQATGKHICIWITALKHTGISFSRLKHHQAALRTFFSMLVKMKYITKNPADALPVIRKSGQSKVRPVSRDTVFRLLHHVDQSDWLGKRNYIIISILWALGLRISELTSLTIGSFEPEIEKNIGLLRVKGKNRKERALFVVGKLYENMKVYLSHHETPKKKSDPLFPVKNNKAISNSRVQKKIKEYCALAGIEERITPHVLRHSFATEMYHEKVPISAIQVMMGHTKPAETAIYIKVNDVFKKEALYQLTISERMSWE